MMSFRVNSLVTSLAIQRYLHRSQQQVEKSLLSLASGKRIVKVSDDVGGFVSGERLREQVSGLRQSKSNAKNAVAMIQTAEGSLNEQSNILVRLRELSVHSINDTVDKEERELLNNELQALVKEFDRIAKTTKFKSRQLLVGSREKFSFHVGPFKGPENVIDLQLNADTTAKGVGLKRISISSQDDALDALDSIDQALFDITKVRSAFGATQSRLQFTIDNLATQEENIEKARSLIVDVDVADEVSRLVKAQIIRKKGVAVLAQANQEMSQAVRLIP